MTTVIIDVSQIRGLADDLRAGYRETARDVQQVVAKGALNVKQDWQREWSGLSHAPALGKAVTYDIRVKSAGYVEAEIGPDKGRRQGPLGNIVEYGTSKNAPHPGGAPALAREDPKFVKAIDDLAAGLLS